MCICIHMCIRVYMRHTCLYGPTYVHLRAYIHTCTCMYSAEDCRTKGTLPTFGSTNGKQYFMKGSRMCPRRLHTWKWRSSALLWCLSPVQPAFGRIHSSVRVHILTDAHARPSCSCICMHGHDAKSVVYIILTVDFLLVFVW